ncbi:MAG: metallophosphoesterase [Bacteroidetes bacterium]|nr:metallophosphoesterase [Bacteroidota bacterium]
MIKLYRFCSVALFLILTGCATYSAKLSPQPNTEDNSIRKVKESTFYFIGDAGYDKDGTASEALAAFGNYTASLDTQNDQLIFLGDNVYEKGIPKEKADNYNEAKNRIDHQIAVAEQFKGKTIFIPGNHDWYSGLSGVKRQEKLVEAALGKNTFLPENGCPIEKVDVTENVIILALDSQWFIADWDQHPTINDNCEIKSRNDFFLELEGELKKNNEKTIILAMHHPAYTYGPHGGGFNVDKHLFPFKTKIPLPVLGSLVTQLRSQGGVSPQDRYNKRYDELMGRLLTLAKGSDRLVIASGHEHTLQYIDKDGVKQIVSGSGSKESPVKLGEGAQFVTGRQGFVQLDVFTDGSSNVTYFEVQEGGGVSAVFNTNVHAGHETFDTANLPSSFEPTIETSAYNRESTNKGNSYNWFWGDHYRYVYGTDIKVPVITLDTLMGGVTIARKGGGHQTRSLRLLDQDGRNFAMRAVKKSAVQFLQSVAFKDNYVENDFKETLTEEVILDFYTASHPYGSFVVGPLADAIGVYHTNPKLMYVPKHKALGKYNAEFGDELYIVEERPDDDFLDVASFGKPEAIESTADVLKKLRKDEKYMMDHEAFIKARLFDMLLGDWDRHQDQWRWSRFDIDGKKVYRPIPRDRDQVFSNYDGALLDVLKVIIPATKQFQEYDGELKDVKWINLAGIRIDRAFTEGATIEDWKAQATYITEHLTDTAIDDAFKQLPSEVQDDTMEKIKTKLKQRRGNLYDVAMRYYQYLSKLVVITGTDKDDYFEIIREDNRTKVSVSRIKNGEKQLPYKTRIIPSEETNEIWIYGLDDDDQFAVSGNGSKPIFTRIIGGQNNDSYTIENGNNVKVHDHKSKPNTILKKGGASVRLSDSYQINNYDYSKHISRMNSLLPSIGANPDDGLKIGLQDTYVIKGFKTDPFHQKHQVRAGYYFATEGFDVAYNGEFADTFGHWNLLLEGHFTSENFTRNFFGFGNNSADLDEDLDLDFNRIKTGILSGKIGIAKDGDYGSRLVLSAGFENIEVEATSGRFTTDFFDASPETFEAKNFASAEMNYSYSSHDNGAAPSRGMFFKLNTGIRTNLEETDRTYGYINPGLQFYNSLSKNRRLVLKTMARGQFNIGDQFEFYQAATLGAGDGLRGYRTQRFSGESALALGADLRYSFAKFKTGLLPLQLGVFGGADTGRVWLDGEDSDVWHSDFGGGLWINAVDAISGQLGIFSGGDGMRISFGFGVSL